MRLEDSQFYLLGAPETENRLCKFASSRVTVREEINCPIDPGHARIGRFFSNLSVVVPGPPAADILFTWVSHCLAQQRVLGVMERERQTGFWTKPAEALLRKTGEPIAVRQLCVSGWGGVVPAESGIRQVVFCPACRWIHWPELTNPEGLIQPRNWDGSDFFMIWPMPLFVVVSERVVRVFKDHKLKGAHFSKSFPAGSGTGLSPQRLSYWMPEKRAHDLGDDLDIF
jgi:hypothetical protein